MTISAFFRLGYFTTTRIMALPILNTIQAFTPMFLCRVIASLRLLYQEFIRTNRVASRRRRIHARHRDGGRIVIVRRATITTGKRVSADLFRVFITYLYRISRYNDLSTTSALLFANSASKATASARLSRVNSNFSRMIRAFLISGVANASRRLIAVIFLSPLRYYLLPFKVTVKQISARCVSAHFGRHEGAFRVITYISPHTCRRFLVTTKRLFQVITITIMIFTRSRVLRILFLISSQRHIRFIVPSSLINFARYRTRFTSSRFKRQDRRFFRLLIKEVLFNAVITANRRARRFAIEDAIIHRASHEIFNTLCRDSCVYRHVFKHRVKITSCGANFRLLCFPSRFNLTISEL